MAAIQPDADFGKQRKGASAGALRSRSHRETQGDRQFLLMGNTRSYWEFYRGLGLVVTIMLTAEAALFWLLGSLAKTDARRLRPIVGTFLVAYAALAMNSYAYFFLAPVIVESLIAACLGLAMVTSKGEAGDYAGKT